MAEYPNVEQTDPSGRWRIALGNIWITEADYHYVVGVLDERQATWEEFVHDALLAAAAT